MSQIICEVVNNRHPHYFVVIITYVMVYQIVLYPAFFSFVGPWQPIASPLAAKTRHVLRSSLAKKHQQ